VRFFVAILLVLFSLVNLPAQKSPYHIRNYKPAEYAGYMQTWQVLQDKRGLIFLASTSTVHIYDGQEWQAVPVTIGAATRQILYDSLADVIYVGSVGNFGCLEKDSTGKFYYHSFVDQLKPEEAVFSDVWKVQQQGRKIYFQSAEHIFVVEDKKVVGRIDPAAGSTFALMFNCAERLFVRQRGVGLMELTGSTMWLVPGSEMFATTRLMGMLPVDKNNFYLLTGDQGFVHMSNAAATQPAFAFFPLPNDTFLVQNNVLGVEWINDHEFCVSSRYGMMIYNRDFTPKVLFNKATGMNDESVSEFFVDREQNIWVAHNQGCTMISYSSPFLFYDEDYGFEGTLETMAVTADTLYIGSSTGLYRAIGVNSGPMHFTRIPAVPNETWDIMLSGAAVFASSSTGLYEIIGDASTQLSDRYTNGSVWLDTNQTLLAAEKGGFTIFSTNAKREWKEERHFEIPGMEFIRFSSPESTGKPDEFRFYAATRFKSIAIVDFNYKDSALYVRELGPVNGLPANDYFPTKYKDTVYFLGYRTACRYIPARDKNDSAVCVAPADDIFDLIYTDVKNVTGRIDCRLFLEQRWSRATSFFGRKGNEVILEPIMLGSVFYNTSIQYGCVQEPNTVWLLSQQSMIRFNRDHVLDTAAPYSALITHVRFGGDSIDYSFPDRQMEVKYAQNSVSFRFAAPYFKYDKSSVYQYMLIGYDTGWSEPTLKPEKEYTNLPEGTYTFVVKASNMYDVQSEEARFTFTILPPWYRTAWAYCLYAAAFLLLIYLTVRISARTLRKQKERLEQVVKERTAEVVKQKQQIEKQKVDLEEAYTGIQDSIQYSQRIQNAILPTSEEIKRIVPESFVLFFPRDIVSGDFYWFAERNGLKFIACVDCTGHGVPGALMSMIGNTILNQIILERNILEPDQVLNNLHIGVRHALKQDAGGDTRDGMDLSLIVIDEAKQLLHYAGANRNLWIIRHGVLLETKADKFPIAGYQPEEIRRFTSHAIPLQKGDVIYLTTDGYADQFGGARGKKFMVKQLARILLEIHQQPMSEQKAILDEKFRSWKGMLEQVDDVLVIGLRI
jgi:serine phosphatase RsbU (regulator of sigma subunit)